MRSRDWLTFPGILRPDELLERAGVSVPEEGPYETVAGWLMSELGRLPVVGDTVEIDARRRSASSGSTAAASTACGSRPRPSTAEGGDD